jgi:hypothetical protein
MRRGVVGESVSFMNVYSFIFFAYHRRGRAGCQGKSFFLLFRRFFASKSRELLGDGVLAHQMTTLLYRNGLILSCRVVLG